MKHKNILVTGGSGFIGTNLLKKLSFNSNYNLSSNYELEFLAMYNITKLKKSKIICEKILAAKSNM